MLWLTLNSETQIKTGVVDKHKIVPFTKFQRYKPIMSVCYTYCNIITVTVFISFLIHEVHIT